jgi:hypothetical protein
MPKQATPICKTQWEKDCGKAKIKMAGWS